MVNQEMYASHYTMVDCEYRYANRISLIVAFFQKINFNLILLAGVLAVNGDYLKTRLLWVAPF